ncbi:MAG: hypothetical protein Q9194_003203 [Teloschistes cf. exilis]
MAESPTIVLVQDSFQVPAVYERLVHSLHNLGYMTIQPRLPSCSDTGGPEYPKTTLIDDALAVRKELVRQVEYQHQTVVVVMHSYGGLVGGEAIPEDLSYTKRQSFGLPGGVIHLFYFCAYVLDQGESLLGTCGDRPSTNVHPDGRIYFLEGERKLYNDLPEPEASTWASRLMPSSRKVQTTILTRAAWRYTPSTYLVCENDQALPPHDQAGFAATAKAHVETCTAGHSPMLSSPDMLAQKIHQATLKAISGPLEAASFSTATK